MIQLRDVLVTAYTPDPSGGGDRVVRLLGPLSLTLTERRIAIVATQHLIRNHDFKDTLRLAVTLIDDDEDLMHKATGWMLREVGKRDERVLRRFLDKYAHRLPRTALRYSLERLPAPVRRRYMEQGQ